VVKNFRFFYRTSVVKSFILLSSLSSLPIDSIILKRPKGPSELVQNEKDKDFLKKSAFFCRKSK